MGGIDDKADRELTVITGKKRSRIRNWRMS